MSVFGVGVVSLFSFLPVLVGLARDPRLLGTLLGQNMKNTEPSQRGSHFAVSGAFWGRFGVDFQTLGALRG